MVYAIFARKNALSKGSSAVDNVNQAQIKDQHAGDSNNVNDSSSPSDAVANDDWISMSRTENLGDAPAGDSNTLGALPPMIAEESESTPVAPIQFGTRTIMNLLSDYPEDIGVDVEPSSSTDQNISMAAENCPAEREHLQPHDPLDEPRAQPDHLGADPVSTQVNAESAHAPKPRKRRRRGPRLTRVKNERAKKAQARAKAKAKGNDNAVEPRVEATTPLEGTELRDGTARRTRRAMARVTEHAEGSGAVENARKSKGKGKTRSKDLPSDDETATGAKRKRCPVDDEAEGAPQEDLGEPGPSRPTRRTRQKLEAPVDGEAPLPLPTRRTRAITRAAAEAPEPARGLKRYRSLAPEPSEGRIDAERKRARLECPERPDNPPVATSSRVTLDHSNTSIKVEETGHEVPYDDPMDDNVAIEEPMQVQSDQVIAVDSEQESADAGSEPPNYPPANSSEEGAVCGPSEDPSPPQQLFPCREGPFFYIGGPERPPRTNWTEQDLGHLLRIPPSPVPPPGMFPPLPPGNRLRRHKTKIIGGKVYRPEDPYYYRR